jgi:hypothetical protein
LERTDKCYERSNKCVLKVTTDVIIINWCCTINKYQSDTHPLELTSLLCYFLKRRVNFLMLIDNSLVVSLLTSWFNFYFILGISHASFSKKCYHTRSLLTHYGASNEKLNGQDQSSCFLDMQTEFAHSYRFSGATIICVADQ